MVCDLEIGPGDYGGEIMQISQSMKKKIVTTLDTATVADAANLFWIHHIGMLPVIDNAGHLVGILQLRNLLHLIMPVFVDLIEDFDYVGDFGAIEDREPAREELDLPISEVMEAPVYVEEDSGLVRAFAFIHKHDLLDLPVVNGNGKLVGLASRVDIGRALLATWWQYTSDNQS
jgi:CBS-domain-containing membrane protein